jgi:putative ATP-dependent endonuclease of OLD family
MLSSFPGAFDLNEADQISPIDSKIKAVLGDRCHGVDQYTEDQKKLFVTYHKRFKLSSKPATHINALSNLTDTELLAGMPPSLSRLADYVSVKLVQLPE